MKQNAQKYIDTLKAYPTTIKYVIVCKDCGDAVGKREKACNLTKHPEKYQCTDCDGELEVVKI